MSALSDLEALYRETVLEHYRRPRNRVPLRAPDGAAIVHNPVCGDQVRAEVRMQGEVLAEVAAISRGCSIAVAAGSVLSEWAPGHTGGEVAAAHTAFEALVSGADKGEGLPEPMRAFARVAALPSRRRCALLAWEALEAALADAGDQRIV